MTRPVVRIALANVRYPATPKQSRRFLTGQRHGLVLATRNVKDTASTGVKTLNPFAG